MSPGRTHVDTAADPPQVSPVARHTDVKCPCNYNSTDCQTVEAVTLSRNVSVYNVM